MIRPERNAVLELLPKRGRVCILGDLPNNGNREYKFFLGDEQVYFLGISRQDKVFGDTTPSVPVFSPKPPRKQVPEEDYAKLPETVCAILSRVVRGKREYVRLTRTVIKGKLGRYTEQKITVFLEETGRPVPYLRC